MKTKLIFLAIFLIVGAGAGYYIWRDLEEDNLEAKFPSGVIVEQSAEISEMPDLNRPINITVDVSEEVREIYRQKIEELTLALKENPGLLNAWLDLGIYRQNSGDYEGAKECWEYAGNISPENSTSFQNLGNLYAYYLKDNKKSEENYLKALENGPKQIYIYRNVYEFYRYVMKDEAMAKQILEKGIELNLESSQDLQNLLDNF